MRRFLPAVAILWLTGLLATPACAQQATATPGGNILRGDWLAPCGANLGYNLLSNRGFVFPILVSYERRLAPAWSLNAEGLVNGGDPTDQRAGAGLGVRRYLRANGQLAGPYVMPLISYRSLRAVEGYYGPDPVASRSQRVGTGALLGWQLPLGSTKARRFTLDLSGGAAYWGRVGTDYVENASQFYYDPQPQSNRNGWWVDVRGGIGYQF